MRSFFLASLLLILSPAALAAGCGVSPARTIDARPAAPAAEAPETRKIRGELVCLLEEVQKRYGAQVPPVHEHLTGLKAEDGALYTIVRTPGAVALWKDPRFSGRTLLITGRLFPRSSLLEAYRTDWIHDGKVYDVYYWCEVCSIRGLDPGPCACCQGPVELRERPEGGGPETRIPDAAPPAPAPAKESKSSRA